MKAIALTGSIGSGKTTVLKIVRSLGIATIDSDRIVAGLYREKGVQQKIRGLFGTSDKKKVASTAFSSTAKRRKLQRLLHPPVWREVRARLAAFRKQGKALAVVEVPLLFEAGWQHRFDSVIFVKAPKKACIKRLLGKGLSRKEALLRWKAQLPTAKKLKKAQHVIDNSGTVSKTRKQARQLLAGLVKQDG